AGVFPSFEIFEREFDKCTKDCGAMVIDNREINADITHKVYCLQTKGQEFMFGSREFKKAHNEWYNPYHSQHNCIKICNENSSVDDKSYENTDYLFEYFVNPNKVKDSLIKISKQGDFVL